MGSWHLEVARMALYISFPVAMFHIFNQPRFFEKWVIDLKREVYPPDSDPELKKLRAALEEIKKNQSEYFLESPWPSK